MNRFRQPLIVCSLISLVGVAVWWRFADLRDLFGSNCISVLDVRQRWMVDLPAIQRAYGNEFGITAHDIDRIRERVGSLEIDLRTDMAVVQDQDRTWHGTWSAELGDASAKSLVVHLSDPAPLVGKRAIFTKFQGRIILQFDEMAMILAVHSQVPDHVQ